MQQEIRGRCGCEDHRNCRSGRYLLRDARSFDRYRTGNTLCYTQWHLFFNSYVQNDKILILYVIHFYRYWMLVQAGAHKRKPNGILGTLCRELFPGLVMHAGNLEPAYTWDHYIAVPDAEDREGRSFGNKARRVVGEFWVSRRTILVNSYHIFETL